MQDIKTYKQKDALCGDREYQKEAIRQSIIFLASGRYVTTRDLVDEEGQFLCAFGFTDSSFTLLGNIFQNYDLLT